MSDSPNEQGFDPFDPGHQQPSPGNGGDYSQRISHRQVGARVPDSVARGAFSSGAIIITGQSEFVVDFVVRMQRPYVLASRVVVPHAVMPRIIAAVEDNLGKYSNRFGPPKDIPRPNPPQKPNIQDVYDDLKINEDAMSGAYANGVMIGHSPSEFILDFVTNFFPQAAVSSRVFLSASQMPVFLESLKRTYSQYEQQRGGQGPGDGSPQG